MVGLELGLILRLLVGFRFRIRVSVRVICKVRISFSIMVGV